MEHYETVYNNLPEPEPLPPVGKLKQFFLKLSIFSFDLASIHHHHGNFVKSTIASFITLLLVVFMMLYCGFNWFTGTHIISVFTHTSQLTPELIKKIDYKYMDANGKYEIGFKSTLSCDDSYISYEAIGTDKRVPTGIKGNFTCEKWLLI